MKKIIFLSLICIVSSCQFTERTNIDKIEDNITYFKDSRTGLCFAAINSLSLKSLNEFVSITCVPCDSVKHLIK